MCVPVSVDGQTSRTQSTILHRVLLNNTPQCVSLVLASSSASLSLRKARDGPLPREGSPPVICVCTNQGGGGPFYTPSRQYRMYCMQISRTQASQIAHLGQASVSHGSNSCTCDPFLGHTCTYSHTAGISSEQHPEARRISIHASISHSLHQLQPGTTHLEPQALHSSNGQATHPTPQLQRQRPV